MITADDSGDWARYVPSERVFWVLWIVITAWLLACAFLVKGEYGDGYQTIANARYLFSDNPLYYTQRGPLAAIVLWPVEVLVDLFDVGPFDLTPYHIYSAVLHSIYLLGCWWALRGTGASAMARIIAFATAVPTVVFYGFSPFLNHDILPGLLFLLMIYIANRWMNRHSLSDALLLVVIGSSVVLIKQTYALFWVVIVIYAAAAMLLGWDERRVGWRGFLVLVGLAVSSAILVWTGYGLFLGGEWAHLPLWFRPFAQVDAVYQTFGKNTDLVFPADMYLRNLHNYGMLAMLLLLPGIVLAFRGRDPRQRMIAVCWLVSVVAMQLVTFREVRYLVFLAPLTAMLVAPAIEWAGKRRMLLAAMVFIVAADQVRGLSVAARQLTSTASIDPIRFFQAAGNEGRVVASRILSFVYEAESPLLRDPYHGIYHISARQIYALQEDETTVYELGKPREFTTADLQPGDRVFYANDSVIRHKPWLPDNSPHMLNTFTQVAGRAVAVTLRRHDGGFVTDGYEEEYVMLVPAAGREPTFPALSRSVFSVDELETLYGSLYDISEFETTGIIIDAICRADRCNYR